MHPKGFVGNVALGIDIDVKGLASRNRIQKLDAADLDDPMPLGRIETGGFRVEDDFPHLAFSVSAGNARERPQNSAHLLPRRVKSASGVDDELRPCAFFRIWHLPPQYDGKPLRRHARTLADALLLHSFRRAHENHGIDLAVKARLEQKGDIKNNKPRTLLRRICQEIMAGSGNQWMHNAFEPRERRRVVEDPRAKQTAIDNALSHGAWKRRLDQGSRRTFVESMDDSIRVMDRNSLLAEHRGGCRFSHADRAGEAKNKHQAAARISASARARSSAVTDGVAPNQRANPGTA